jgi:single-strand DNA-binding protein
LRSREGVFPKIKSLYFSFYKYRKEGIYVINNVTLVGRLTKDPELKYTPNGVAVANFTLAVNRPFKSETGPDADFINITVWRKPAENAANYLKKGSLAGVTGSIQTRNYDGSDGKKVYVTEVQADRVQFLDTKGSSDGAKPQTQNTQQQKPAHDPFSGSGQIDISDDDLPF